MQISHALDSVKPQKINRLTSSEPFKIKANTSLSKNKKEEQKTSQPMRERRRVPSLLPLL